MKVLVYNNGQPGQQILLRAQSLAGLLSSKSFIQRDVSVEIVADVGLIKEKIRSEVIHAVIFLTKNMAAVAQELAAEFAPTRVFIFTGRIPKGQAIFIEREWLNPEFLRSIVNTIDEF